MNKNIILKRFFSIITLCQFLLLSCTSIKNEPPISFENGYLNQQIQLRAPNYSNSFKTKDPVNLELKYNSNYKIIFPNNYNLRIFSQTKDNWLEIKEKPTERYPLGNVIFSPLKVMPPVETVVLFPDLPNTDQTYQLRIYVIGDMDVNDGNKKVAAYVDIILNP